MMEHIAEMYKSMKILQITKSALNSIFLLHVSVFFFFSPCSRDRWRQV